MKSAAKSLETRLSNGQPRAIKLRVLRLPATFPLSAPQLRIGPGVDELNSAHSTLKHRSSGGPSPIGRAFLRSFIKKPIGIEAASRCALAQEMAHLERDIVENTLRSDIFAEYRISEILAKSHNSVCAVPTFNANDHFFPLCHPGLDGDTATGLRS